MPTDSQGRERACDGAILGLFMPALSALAVLATAVLMPIQDNGIDMTGCDPKKN